MKYQDLKEEHTSFFPIRSSFQHPWKHTLIYAAIRKRIDDVTYLEDETTSEVNETSSAMRFDSSFNGSLSVGARTNDSAISEMYIGEFNVSQRIAIGKPPVPTPTPTPTWLPCSFPTNE
jgi:hypothetical protein